MAEPILVVNGLNSGYGARQILRGVNVSVRNGEISLLLGSNGAGKSTTLGAIIGLVDWRGGDAIFEGERLREGDPSANSRRGIQLVPEGGRVFADLSVRDNLRMGALSLPGRFKDEQLEPVFNLFPRLAERASQRAGTLSGGERQMVAVGRALIGKPRLMLLDEPFLGLAPVAIVALVRALLDIRRELGVSMLIVESNLRALEIADELFVLTLGRITSHVSEAHKLTEEQREAVRHGVLGYEI